MIKKIILGLGALIGVVFLIGLVIPDHVEMHREIVIDADREAVFALVGDYHQWDKWSPWEDKDPGGEMIISGAPGIGHKMAWDSDVKEVGSGSQVITEYAGPDYVGMALDFGDMGQATANFTLTEVEGGTKVVWSFETNMREGVPFLMKPMSAFMAGSMDKFLGPEYEKGLATLKQVAEAQ